MASNGGGHAAVQASEGAGERASAAYVGPTDVQRAQNFVALGKKIVCVGKNYDKHIAELASGGRPLWYADVNH